MGLFKRTEGGVTALIIDIGSSSVGGAYVRLMRGAVPEILYVARIPVARRAGETTSLEGMERALAETCDLLVGEGGPAAVRAIGSAHIDRVLVTAGPPWEEARVRVLRIEDGKPFTFTRALVKESESAEPVAPGRRVTEDEIILTKLNGYETKRPYGKRASQAEVTILASTIAEEAAAAIDRAIAKAFHTHGTRIRAFMPAAYAALASLYPHQRDHLIIIAGGDATSVASVAGGLLSGTRNIPCGINAFARASDDRADGSAHKQMLDEWLASVREDATKLTGMAGLPGTVFLITHREARDLLTAALGASAGAAATVVPVSSAHLASAVRMRHDADPDTGLTLLALAEARAFEEEEGEAAA